jgi:hypothetical protein
MRKQWLGLFFLLLVGLAGCRPGNLHGPPRTDGQVPDGTIPVRSPEPVTIADLTARPADFEGRYLSVSGRFRPAPVVVCETKRMRSPATWGMSEGEQAIAAAGPGGRIPVFRDEQPALSVTGYWRVWYGATGCGRQAPVGEVWYLDVDRLLSPNPVALVPTAAAAGTTVGLPDGTATSDGAEPELTLTAVSTITISPPLPPEAITPPAGAATVDAYPAPGATTTSAPGSPSVTAASTPSPRASNGTATTATPSGTVTVPANVTSVPGATATTGAAGTPNIEDQIDLLPGSLETGFLVSNQIDRWPIVITATTAITVNLAAELGLDVAFQVRDSGGNILAEQDGGADGQPEFLEDITLPVAGAYELLVSSPNNGTGAYAILINSTESYSFRFQGTVSYGDTRDSEILAFNDHLWHFSGTAGVTITVAVTPAGNANMFMRLFGPDALILVDFHNETGAGEMETLTFTLPESGFYSLVIGEFDYRAADYQISLTGE